MLDESPIVNSNSLNVDDLILNEDNDDILQNIRDNNGIASESSDYGEDWAISSSNSKGNDKCNLIINYLPHSIDDAALLSLFSEYGEINMAKVVKDKASKKSLGYHHHHYYYYYY